MSKAKTGLFFFFAISLFAFQSCTDAIIGETEENTIPQFSQSSTCTPGSYASKQVFTPGAPVADPATNLNNINGAIASAKAFALSNPGIRTSVDLGSNTYEVNGRLTTVKDFDGFVLENGNISMDGAGGSTTGAGFLLSLDNVKDFEMNNVTLDGKFNCQINGLLNLSNSCYAKIHESTFTGVGCQSATSTFNAVAVRYADAPGFSFTNNSVWNIGAGNTNDSYARGLEQADLSTVSTNVIITGNRFENIFVMNETVNNAVAVSISSGSTTTSVNAEISGNNFKNTGAGFIRLEAVGVNIENNLFELRNENSPFHSAAGQGRINNGIEALYGGPLTVFDNAFELKSSNQDMFDAVFVIGSGAVGSADNVSIHKNSVIGSCNYGKNFVNFQSDASEICVIKNIVLNTDIAIEAATGVTVSSSFINEDCNRLDDCENTGTWGLTETSSVSCSNC